MNSVKGTKTEQNLLKAFAGESQARNRYEMYAKVAKKEGYVQIASYFQETADNERSHAKRFFRFLEGGEVEITATYPTDQVGTTEDNLELAAAGEHEEHTDLYPEFAKIAEDEGFRQVAAVFKLIAKIEAHHEQRFLQLLENIRDNKVFEREEKQQWKCSVCGYIHEGNKPPEKCAACLHPKGYFVIREENY